MFILYVFFFTVSVTKSTAVISLIKSNRNLFNYGITLFNSNIFIIEAKEFEKWSYKIYT